MSSRLTRRYEAALVFAAQLHASQRRKGTEIPYLAHLLSVSSLVLEGGGDEDEAIAGLLHDGPEDQGGHATLADIRSLFGDRVADIVAGCTDSYAQHKPAWRTRKEAYLQHLEQAGTSVLLVSCADKLHNAQAVLEDYRQLGEPLWQRFSAPNPREDTLWFYGALADVFRARGPVPLTDRFLRTVAELHGISGFLSPANRTQEQRP